MRNDVQVIAMPLSVDLDNMPDVLSVLAASAALTVSNIPWAGPIGAARVSIAEDGSFIANPTQEQIAASPLDLVVAGTAKAILMVEAGASEVSEEKMLAAFDFAHDVIKTQCAALDELRAKARRRSPSNSMKSTTKSSR
jgi:polyribonucleotide nucleotidyltransferase